MGCRRRHACPILCDRTKYSIEPRRKEISYIPLNEVELTGLVTSCVGTAF